MLSKNYANIYVKDIIPVNINTKLISGGIQDLGNYKEGFCSQINAVHIKKPIKWVICQKKYVEKKKFIKTLSKCKLRDQGFKMKINIKNSVSSKKIRGGLYGLKKGKVKGKTCITKKPQSRWVVLKDWGDCTLACGGGWRFKHRYCYMPKGSDPCKGEAILKKACNTQPCREANIPELNKNKVNVKGVETKILTPVVKVVHVSTRRQKYIVRFFIFFKDFSLSFSLIL